MTFAHPVWLMLIPVILGFGGIVEGFCQYRRQRDLRRWGLHLQKMALVNVESGPMRFLRYFLSGTGILSLLLALAQPRWGTKMEKRQHQGLSILFALDTSKSMLAEDVRPNRLQLAKLSVLEILDHLRGNQVGLIAFSGGAFLQCPLTRDYGAFRLSLDALDTQVIPRGGTDIAAAIRVAQQAFDTGKGFKYLVLLTDGEDLGAEGVKQAKIAAKEGLVVFTVGIGSVKGDKIPVRHPDGHIEYVKDASGQYVTTRLDEETLAEIAQSTKGSYVPLGNAGEGLRHIYETTLRELPRESFESVEQKPIERYRWFATVALLALVAEWMISFLPQKKR